MSAIGSEQPSFATLRTLHTTQYKARDVGPLPAYGGDALAGQDAYLHVASYHRFVRTRSGDYDVQYGLGYEVTRGTYEVHRQRQESAEAVLYTEEPIATGTVLLGATAYADVAAPFNYSPVLLFDERYQLAELPLAETPEAALAAALARVQRLGIFEDASASAHEDLLRAYLLAPYAWAVALEIARAYETPQRRRAAFSPFDAAWLSEFNDYGDARDTISLFLAHEARAPSDPSVAASSTEHVVHVRIVAERGVPIELQVATYVLAHEARVPGAASAIMRTDDAIALMAVNQRMFRGPRDRRYRLADVPVFVGETLADWDALARAVVVPFLWTVLVHLKERAGDVDADDIARALDSASDVHTIIYAESAFTAATVRAPSAAPAPCTAESRRVTPRLAALAAEAALPLPPLLHERAGGPVLELAAIDVRYAGVPRRSEFGTLNYRPAGHRRRLVSIAVLVRVRDANAFRALPNDAPVFELFGPVPPRKKKVWNDDVASEPFPPDASVTLATVTKGALRVNALYRDEFPCVSAVMPSDAPAYFVCAFIVPIARADADVRAPHAGRDAARAAADAADLASYLEISATFAEVFWLDALLARVAPDVRARIAEAERRTFAHASTMPSIERRYILTESARAALSVPYYAALVASGTTDTAFTAALQAEETAASTESGEEEQEGALTAAKPRVVSEAAVTARRVLVEAAARTPHDVPMHGHAHTLLDARDFRLYAMRWHRTSRPRFDPPLPRGIKSHRYGDSWPNSYYVGAATHVPDAVLPYDDQRVEALLNTGLAELMFLRQRSLGVRLAQTGGALERADVTRAFSQYFGNPLSYDLYFDTVRHVTI